VSDAADESVAEEVERARQTVIEALERSAEVYGAKRSYGRLFGVLLFAEDPLSLDELAAESEYAKSTVSTAMSTLERFHLVHRRSIPGEGKKAYFEAETDLWYVFQQFLQQEVAREISVMTRALDDAAETLEKADGEQAQRDLEKVEDLRRMYRRSERLVSVLTSHPLDRLSNLVGRLTGGSGGE
jgi:DNA-binding transcriptional regulator GbsR (MarR family)